MALRFGELQDEDPRVQALKVKSVRTYLEQNGWNCTPHPNRKLWTFRSDAVYDSGERVQLFIPNQDHFSDKSVTVAIAINLIAALNDCSAEQVLSAIQSIQDRAISVVSSDSSSALVTH